jgi:hypothetical protein
MATFSLQLLSFPGNYEGKEAPYGCRAWIGLKTYSIKKFPVKRGKDQAAFHLITPDCVTFQELDHEVNRLIKELKTIRTQGKRFFEKDDAKREQVMRKTVE